MQLDLTHAIVVGRAHLNRQTPCQDATASATSDHGVAFAVADGLGSAKLSEYGSHAAVNAAAAHAVERLGAMPVAEIAVQAMHAAATRVENASGALRTSPDLLATTLSVAVIDEHSVAIAAVGDGIHIVRELSGRLFPVAMTPPGRHTDRVDPLSANMLDRLLQLDVLPVDGVDGVLLSSDGLESLLLRRPADWRRPYPPLAHALLDGDGGGPDALLRQQTLRSRVDDDCSVVIARRRPVAGGELVGLPGGGALRIGRRLDAAPGRRYWPVLDRPGLRLLRLPPDVRPDVEEIIATGSPVDLYPPDHEHPRVAWPHTAVFGDNGRPLGIAVRDPGGAPADAAACAAHRHQLFDLICALHDGGLVHGTLTPAHFQITATVAGSTLSLVDPVSLFAVGHEDARRREDLRFIEALAGRQEVSVSDVDRAPRFAESRAGSAGGAQ